MDLMSHLREFEDLEVRDYDPLQPGLGDLERTCPRIFTIHGPHAKPIPVSTTRKVTAVAVIVLAIVGAAVWSWHAILIGGIAVAALRPTRKPHKLWERFLAEDRLEEVQALVIGPWFVKLAGPGGQLDRLIGAADRLTGLRSIFVDDSIGDKLDITVTERNNLTPLLDAYPQLETLTVRDAKGLRFKRLEHANLRKLVVQGGELDSVMIADVAESSLPALEHLELWLGQRSWGDELSVDEVRPLWQPSLFPALKTLALRNCPIADDIADALSTQPEAVSRLDRLDLSLGTLSDAGAQSLFNNPAVQALDSLDVHFHFLSDDWAEKLTSLPLDVDVSEAQGYVSDPDSEFDDERYVAVGK